MNLTLSLDEQLVARARKKTKAMGKSLNEFIREQLEKLTGDDDAEKWIAEFRACSGGGNSDGWKFNRDEIHERS